MRVDQGGENATVTLPGVLVRVFGQGVLLTGASGVGKSDTAWQLIERGHQLVADDAVELRAYEGDVHGRAPSELRGKLEVRGLGICSVKTLLNEAACIPETRVHGVVELRRPTAWHDWPRLEPVRDVTTLAGIQVPRMVLPIAPERPLALLVEATVRLGQVGMANGGAPHE